jgi:hypothetical protein
MTKKKGSSSASARRLLLAEELEGIENKIMETGLLSDLVPISDFDVQLQIFECGKTTAKTYLLNIDIGCDDEISFSTKQEKLIASSVTKYLLTKFDLAELGIDPKKLKETTVTVNYGGMDDED